MVGWVATVGGLEVVGLILLIFGRRKQKKKTASYSVYTLDIICDLASVFLRSSLRCFLHHILYKRIVCI